MAGAVTDSELSNVERGQPRPREPVPHNRADKGVRTPRASVHFRLAEASDDEAIRRLLRENPSSGSISMASERESSFFAGTALAGAEEETILAFERGQLVCMGRCSTRPRFIGGAVRQVGYLADLRLDSSVQGRFDILRRGYRFLHQLHESNPADFYFTSIAEDNFRSLRFLERGLPGMPRYDYLSEFLTFLIPVPRRREQKRARGHAPLNLASGCEENLQGLVDLMNRESKLHDLGACWTADELRGLARHGLRLSDFQIATDGTKLLACAALWDQRAFKQTVLRGYSPPLSVARPLVNIAARIFDTPRMPEIGATLSHAFLSPLAIPNERTDVLLAFLEDALDRASVRGLEFLSLGFAAADPRSEFVRKHFRCREYQTRIYRVFWPSAASAHSGSLTSNIFPTADSRTQQERGIYAASGLELFARVARFRSLVFSAVKRHKCRAPGDFLNPPCIFPEVALL